jgi:2-octaprenyl-6-methoxyphenol hydroxylase
MADVDVLIVGGGPVGAAAALALGDRGLALGLVEPRDKPMHADPRPIALAHGSRLILERLGVWDRIAPVTPIERIHVSQRGGFGRLALDAQEAGLPALGYVVDYGRIADALRDELAVARDCRVIRSAVTAVQPGIDSASACLDADSGRITARLIVVAEGGALAGGPARVRDYRQSVVTARVGSTAPHGNVAYERFTPEGPLALLPMGAGLALVWTTVPERARELCELPDVVFLQRLQEAFGGRLGIFTGTGPRTCYPLSLKVAPGGGPRLIAIGNAAQTLHPVAGQGLNLGLRDAWELAATAGNYGDNELGASIHLAAYRKRRYLDRSGGIGFTDALVRLFSNDIAPLKAARGLGLALLGAAPPAKQFLVRRMTFGTRGWRGQATLPAAISGGVRAAADREDDNS